VAYWMAPVLRDLNDLEGHSLVAGLFKCNLSNICVAFYQISTDSVLAQSLSDSWASLQISVGSVNLMTLWCILPVLCVAQPSIPSACLANNVTFHACQVLRAIWLEPKKWCLRTQSQRHGLPPVHGLASQLTDNWLYVWNWKVENQIQGFL